MKNFLKIVGIRIGQGIIFAAVYVLISLIMKDDIDVTMIASIAVGYVVAFSIFDAVIKFWKGDQK